MELFNLILISVHKPRWFLTFKDLRRLRGLHEMGNIFLTSQFMITIVLWPYKIKKTYMIHVYFVKGCGWLPWLVSWWLLCFLLLFFVCFVFLSVDSSFYHYCNHEGLNLKRYYTQNETEIVQRFINRIRCKKNSAEICKLFLLLKMHGTEQLVFLIMSVDVLVNKTFIFIF